MSNYKLGSRVTCPSCGTKVRLDAVSNTNHILQMTYAGTKLALHISACPECEHIVIAIGPPPSSPAAEVEQTLIWPTSIYRPPVPREVPDHIARDYCEAAAVLPISAKASAALSRRCLQAVLREAGTVQAGNLHNEIEQVLETVPNYLSELLHLVRVTGNFAAHPMKSEATGQIVDVEPEEAELNLDVLDELFDYFYVKPARNRRIKEGINQKLRHTNKPELN